MAQQISLFDKNGEAICYIDYNEKTTIYIWDETPIAFLQKERNEECIFGLSMANFLVGLNMDKCMIKMGI